VITDEDWLTRLVGAIAPRRDDRAIEIATGRGYVAMALAMKCREVVGVDLTQAPLRIAERTRQSRRLTNVSFRTADADELPFADGEFDVAVCRFAFHHFEHPEQVIAYINLPRTLDIRTLIQRAAQAFGIPRKPDTRGNDRKGCQAVSSAKTSNLMLRPGGVRNGERRRSSQSSGFPLMSRARE
jgi:hypothetical protein